MTLTRPVIIKLSIAAAAALAAALLFGGYIAAQLRYAVRGPAEIAAPEATEPARPTVQPNTLWIASIGVVTPIIDVTVQTERAYQAALEHGVGHFPGTAAIGQPGNAYLFGHSSDFGWNRGDYKTVFALLPSLKEGDAIVASDRDGNAFVYVVTGHKVVAPDDLSVLEQGNNEKSLLTLQTSYPLGTALKRYLVFAELVQQ